MEKSLKSFFYNLSGVILPFLISLLVLSFFMKLDMISSFLDEGDTLLFSAGLYTTSWYMFNENKHKTRTSFDKVLSHLTLLFLIFSSSLYAIVYSRALLIGYQIPYSIPFIRISSSVLFTVSIIALYRSTYIAENPVPNIEGTSASDVKEIMDEL